MSNFLDGLNEAQRKAVEATEGPLLVLAGAGAGKTKTITYRILNLIKKGVAPENILAVTFTNKAAKEMADRITSVIASEVEISRPVSFAGKPFVSTFHGLGAFIIRENFKAAGVKKHFSIFDRGDSKKAIKEALEKINLSPKEFEPGKILSIISREKGNFVTAEDFLEAQDGYFGGIAGQVWREYQSILDRENALDFDDLLLVTAKLLEKNEIRDVYSSRWQYLHIDEYQDTNKVQYKIAESIARDHQNICAVGDIDQNIYSWRGANIRNILNFEKDYKNAKLVLLEENYRSTQTILAVANRIIEKNKHRKKKTLVTKNAIGEKIGIFEAVTEAHEAQFVTEKVKGLREFGVPLSEIAVLYRANFQSRVLEEEFLSKNIPYQVLGTRFFERKEVKDILSFIRLSFNTESITDLKRVINVPPRGIGKTTLLKIVEGKEGALPQKMKLKLAIFRNLLSKIRSFAASNPPSKTVIYIAEEAGILRELGKSEEDQERLENIKELSALASRYDHLYAENGGGKRFDDSVERFMEDCALASDQDSDKGGSDSVRLMTVHASKGLEFSYVFITGLEQGLFPSDKDRDENVSEEESEEERRLFYVALTRAKKKLFLSYAESRTIFGSRGANIPSEFILEVPEEYTEREFLDFTPRRKPLLHIEY
jgi:DNA helicase-2/ATP-dependent DNA helicase PcrA